MNLEIDLHEKFSPNSERHESISKNEKASTLNDSSDLKNLLSKISTEPYDASPFLAIEVELNPIIDDEETNLIAQDQPYLIEIISQIEQIVKQKLKGFDPSKVSKFSFELPPTVFKTISSDIDVIHNHEGDPEYLETTSLTCKQRCEIFKTGRFTVKSHKFKQDYIWKMSNWIMKGRVEINKSLKDDMNSAKDMLKDWWKAFYRPHTHDLCESNIVNGLGYMWNFTRNIISIFLGYPKIYPVDTDSTPYFLCDYFLQLNDDETLDKSLWKYFFEKKKLLNENYIENQNFTYLLELEKHFAEIWKKQKFVEEKKLKDDETLKKKLQEIYYQNLTKYMIENNKSIIPENLLKLLEIFKCLIIIHSQVFEYDNLYKEHLEAFKTNIKKIHSILCKFDCYYNKKLDQYQKNELEKLENERNQKINVEFSNLEYFDHINLFSRYLNFLKYYHENKKAADFLLREYRPYRVFHFTMQLFPNSWKVESYTDYNGKIQYRLIKTEIISYSTENWFWRFFIMIIRYAVWVKNAIYWLFVMAISGHLGIRALCGISAFHPDKECTSTGQIIEKENPKVQTVISTFGLVCESIQDDRDNFEAQPDRGFFGKKFTRLCNLFYNYIFKFIIIGLFLTLVCFPVLIILNVFSCIFLALTSFLWMPFVLILFKLFQVIFYDSDNEGAQQGRRSHTYEWFPLIAEILITLGYHCIFQILVAILLLLMRPILFVLIVAFGLLRFILRSFYDVFMMLFILLFGRVPVSDTAIAWKISGPVVSRKFYDRMTVYDALKIYVSKLEDIELKQYEQEIRSNLKKNFNEVEKFYKNLNSPFSISTSIKYVDYKEFKKKDQSNLQTLRKSEEILSQKLNDSLSKRRQNFPNSYSISNVRFNVNDLEFFKASSKKILKTFVERRNIQSHWNHVDFLDEKAVDKINEEIMKNSTNYNILEPFEELDERIELVDRREQFGTIKDVLQGKTGNAVENLINIEVKPRIEIGIKYFLTESTLNMDSFHSDLNYVVLENSVKFHVNVQEYERQKAEKIQVLKPSFAEINRKYFS